MSWLIDFSSVKGWLDLSDLDLNFKTIVPQRMSNYNVLQIEL